MDWMIATEDPNGSGYLFPKDLPDKLGEDYPWWTLWEEPSELDKRFPPDGGFNEFGLIQVWDAFEVTYDKAKRVADERGFPGTPIGG